MKESAMQELKQRLNEIGFEGVDDFINPFLEKEKQQIIDAHMKGQLWNKSGYNPNECQKYYSETFNNND